jgi:hypothetical protein
MLQNNFPNLPHEEQPVDAEKLQNLWDRLEPRLHKKKDRRRLVLFFLSFSLVCISLAIFLLQDGYFSDDTLTETSSNTLRHDHPKAIDSALHSHPKSVENVQHHSLPSHEPHHGIVSSQAQNSMNEIEDSKNSSSGFDIATPSSDRSAISMISETNSYQKFDTNAGLFTKDVTLAQIDQNKGKMIHNGSSILSYTNRDTLHSTSFDVPLAYMPCLHLMPLESLSKISLKPLYILPYLSAQDNHHQPFVFKIGINTNVGKSAGITSLNTHSMALQNAIKRIPGYGVEGIVNYSVSKKWAFIASGRYDRYIEKFEFSNSITSKETFVNTEAFKSNNTYISAEQIRIRKLYQDVLHYNSNHTVSLSLGLGYHPDFAPRWSLEGSLQAIVYQKYTGRWLDPNLIILHDANQVVKSVFKTFYPHLRVNYLPIRNKRVEVQLSYLRMQYGGLDPLGRSHQDQVFFGFTYPL